MKAFCPFGLVLFFYPYTCEENIELLLMDSGPTKVDEYLIKTSEFSLLLSVYSILQDTKYDFYYGVN